MTPGDNKMDEVFALRDQHLADVVVLLTNDQDSGALGVAPGVEVASGNAFAVVRWDFAAGNYTFAHEIGHLVGGDHATGSAPRQYAHGYRLPDYDWRTVMATISEDPGTIRIPYWSTPDLYVADPPRLANALGTASRNDNRKMWNLRANAVAGFRGATDPGSVTVTITGPSTLGWKQWGSWTANASGGTGSYTYAWYERSPGGTWNTTGVTTQSYSRMMVDTDFELRVDVTSGSNSASNTHYVTYDGGCCQANRAPETLPELTLRTVTPNPARQNVRLAYELSEAAHVRLVVYDVTGREVTVLIEREQSAGSHTATFARGQLPAGVYIYRLIAQNSATSFSSTGRFVLID